MNILENNTIRHPKEGTYVTIMYVISIFIYISFSVFLLIGIVVAIPFILLFLLFSWLISLYFRAQILGDSLKVSENQFPELYRSLLEYCSRTNISKVPEMFVFNSNGMLNAFAVKLFMKKYIMLTSSIVDLSYRNNNFDELNFIIGHELGHHAAGHTSFTRMFLTYPATIVPFIGAAYLRACELTADRYGLVLSGNRNSSINSLINLAHGSRTMSDKVNITAFEQQENEIPEFMGFIAKLWSTHPRLTIRVKEVRVFKFELLGNYNQQMLNNQYSTPINQSTSTVNFQHSQEIRVPNLLVLNCTKCGIKVNAEDIFCEHCGNKLK